MFQRAMFQRAQLMKEIIVLFYDKFCLCYCHTRPMCGSCDLLCRYPATEWSLIGEFKARTDVRTVQTFPLGESVYAKYIKVWLLWQSLSACCTSDYIFISSYYACRHVKQHSLFYCGICLNILLWIERIESHQCNISWLSLEDLLFYCYQ